jgi:hypothetical protein
MSTQSRTITGINTAITLQINVLGEDGSWGGYYSKNSGADVLIVPNETLICISNNDTLVFRAICNFGFPGFQYTLQVVNLSDGGTELDTITFAVN